jgi:hypothetical protein
MDPMAKGPDMHQQHPQHHGGDPEAGDPKGDSPPSPNRHKIPGGLVAVFAVITMGLMGFVIYSVAEVAKLAYHQDWMYIIWVGCPITIFEAGWLAWGGLQLCKNPLETMFGKWIMMGVWWVIASIPMIMAFLLADWVPNQLDYNMVSYTPHPFDCRCKCYHGHTR